MYHNIGDSMKIEDNSLEKYFNENNWVKFYEYFKNHKTKNTEKLLEKLNGNIELVEVIEGVVGDVAIEWIDRKIPALNNIKPIDCTNDEKLTKMWLQTL
jgi:hypothetical protein